MIELEDCIALCGLTEEEVSEIAATVLGSYLLCHENCIDKIQDMIVDDIRQAQLYGDREYVLTLLHVLHHFLKVHPEAKPSCHPWSGH